MEDSFWSTWLNNIGLIMAFLIGLVGAAAVVAGFVLLTTTCSLWVSVPVGLVVGSLLLALAERALS